MLGPYSLAKIQSLQPSLRPLATLLVDRAAEQGMAVDIVQGYRSPSEQEALYTSGPGVTNAPALLSYHNYGLAFDAVPTAYKSFPDWNPSGPLWQKIGTIGESLGLSWGGRWTKPDKPHFELNVVPVRDLKAYWEKFKEIMPVSLAPTAGGAAIAVSLGAFWYFYLAPKLKKAKML